MNHDPLRAPWAYLPVTLAAPNAAIITLLLVYLMHSLIATDLPDLTEEKQTVLELVQVNDEKLVLEPKQPPQKPVEPATPPDRLAPQLELAPAEDYVATAGPIEMVLDDLNPQHSSGGGIVAYLKPAPMYPPRAASRGIEGYVDLAFDITPSGSTTNIRILEAQPPNVFERNAIKALEKWKYKVPVVDGVTRGQVDMMTRMTFSLEG